MLEGFKYISECVGTTVLIAITTIVVMGIIDGILKFLAGGDRK